MQNYSHSSVAEHPFWIVQMANTKAGVWMQLTDPRLHYKAQQLLEYYQKRFPKKLLYLKQVKKP